MQLCGLTGGIASGKSEAAKRFAARGVPVIDADKVGHAMLAPGGAAAQAVVEAFGDGILSGGRIDREKLAGVVFGDPQARQRLNALVHPPVIREVAERCAALERQGHEIVIVEAALLAEGGARDAWLDKLIVVTCSAKTRRRRLIEIRGMNANEAQQRIDAQTPPETKVPAADWVIENEGTLEELHAQIDPIVGELLGVSEEQAARSPGGDP